MVKLLIDSMRVSLNSSQVVVMVTNVARSVVVNNGTHQAQNQSTKNALKASSPGHFSQRCIMHTLLVGSHTALPIKSL